MLPKVQQLHITRLDGTVSAYRNSEFIPLFYVFPKEILEEAGQIFLEVPRNPLLLFLGRKWIDFVESDLFLQFIIDATAYIVWPFMGLGVAKEFRCHEDFDCRYSNQKIDFTRKWYHTRTKHPTVSLDAEIEQYAKYNNGRELYFEDVSSNMEEQVISEVMIKQFTDSLPDEKELLTLMEKIRNEKVA